MKLFDFWFRKGKYMGNNQHKRISSAVTEFVNNHINQEFTARELRVFVLGRVPNSAPASSDRIMRQLRQTGIINYVLVSRVQSLYKGLPIRRLDIPGAGQLSQQTGDSTVVSDTQ